MKHFTINRGLSILILAILSSGGCFSQTPSPIKAYYTRVSSDDGGYTGKYVDIIVDFDQQRQLVFDSNNGYLPYWQNERKERFTMQEIVKRRSNNPSKSHDKFNTASNVSIVERTDSSVVVHWRYVADVSTESFSAFKSAYNRVGNPSPFYAESVDEYFLIKSDASVERVVKKGCYLADQWEDPKNSLVQNLRLTSEGIKIVSEHSATTNSTYANIVKGTAVKSVDLNNIALRFTFDDGLTTGGMTTIEDQTNSECKIDGVKAYWENGVSGSCLYFDSYSNYVTLPSNKTPTDFDSGFTISCWFAAQEYPFNNAAIVENFNSNEGYFLGINRQGELLFTIGNGTTTKTLKTTRVPLYNWTNVVASYNATSLAMKIYLNGELVASGVAEDPIKISSDSPLTIGMTKSHKQYPDGAERSITKSFQSNMGFSGLIDELYLYKNDLSQTHIDSIYVSHNPKMTTRLRPYSLPSPDYAKNEFGATYKKLKFNTGWDGMWRVGKYADLEVTFDNEPWRYVFWRGTRYLPSLVTDYGHSGIWSNDQGPEAFTGQCYEHMSDMLCRYSNIRLISSNAARVIVHWRNASVNIEYKWPSYDDQGRGIWTDEYWTIYPDGTSVRHQQIYNPQQTRIIEMNQNEILHHPGQTTDHVLMDEAVILGDERGELQRWSRLKGGADKESGRDKNMLYTNLNSSTKQFQIGQIGTRIQTSLHMDIWWNGWDHYPAQLIPSDGTAKVLYDRTASSCVSTFREYRQKLSDSQTEAMQIYGLTRKSPEQLYTLNRSWNFAPNAEPINGCTSVVFAKNEKAYHIVSNKPIVQFRLDATPESPAENPAFVVKNFNGKLSNVVLKVNSEIIDFKKGVEYDVHGEECLVVWVNCTYDKPATFTIESK